MILFPGAAQIAGIGSCRREEDTSRFLIPGFLNLNNPPQGFAQELFPRSALHCIARAIEPLRVVSASALF
jgi:hypothetical protein